MIVCLTCAGEVIGEAGLTLVSYVTETEYRAGDPENLGHTSYTEALGHAQSRMAVNGAGNSKTSIYRLESGRRIWVETLGGLRDITPWNTGAAMPCPTCEEWVQEGDDCAQGHYAQETKEETEEETELAVCVDCAHLLASGELPEGDPEFSLLPEWDGDVLALACGEDREPWFSWSRCDGCGSTLGGDRHPAAVISSPEEEDSNLEAFITEFPHVPEEVLRELLDGYEDATTDDIAYEGEFYSYADLANHMVEEGLFGEIPEHLSRYIDIDAIGRDLDAEGVYEIRHNFTGYYWTIH